MKNQNEGILDKEIREALSGHRFTYLHLLKAMLNGMAAFSIALGITLPILSLTNQRLDNSEKFYYTIGTIVVAGILFITLKALAQVCQILLELIQDDNQSR
ncbi:hypothetical protein [Lentimonas sp. CC4]|uniref:hypothetical protein n=1 Tax=Lentimonas sp. CC4 TaxID=2676099 RepID=UPI001327E9E8|nr:hypothetical protein [Lentimonas sp. CC4]CAA6683624.1 Unannotated [Lentimonas sp. CC6]CAA7169145.1 Unannotated [Lentimonas sp. CC21]CAA7180453.1 Unannotated [Lentimonas sp. CC8]CAA6678638.1 Unannotated [Lentimonas sp. CC4]CAA7074530.1 Unannotated [Lentimonas sp. CC4]